MFIVFNVVSSIQTLFSASGRARKTFVLEHKETVEECSILLIQNQPRCNRVEK